MRAILLVFFVLLTALGFCSPVRSSLGAERNSGGEALPFDSEVEWLEIDNSKKQYIDTGIEASDSVDFCLWFSQEGFSSYYIPLFGSNVDGAYLSVYRNSGNMPSEVFARYGNSTSFFIGNKGYQGIIEKYNGVFSFNGDSIEVQSSPFSSSETLWLGHVNGISFMIGNKKKIGFCKIWKEGLLVRDYIPIKFTNELGESEGGMYDKVSKIIFRNMGTGSFVIGPEV